jgi:DNA-binding transcriptional LysR family regulator
MRILHNEAVMRELRQFVEVANRRSISRAAEHLNISQPALSRAIRQLEESYGAPLFIRTGGGVILSPYGTALYSRAVRVLPALDEAREEIEHLQGRAKASIHIATGDLWGLVILPEVMKGFARDHPNVVVHVDITDDGTRFEGLRNGVYDLVFGTMSFKYEAVMPVEFESMVRQATSVYCDASHPLAGGGLVSVEDLLAQRWISPGYDDDRGPGKLARFDRDFAMRVDKVMHAVLLMQNSSLFLAASSGFVSLFKRFGIVSVEIEDQGPVSESGAIYLPRALEKPLVRDFLRRAHERVSELELPIVR